MDGVGGSCGLICFPAERLNVAVGSFFVTNSRQSIRYVWWGCGFFFGGGACSSSLFACICMNPTHVEGWGGCGQASAGGSTGS